MVNVRCFQRPTSRRKSHLAAYISNEREMNHLIEKLGTADSRLPRLSFLHPAITELFSLDGPRCHDVYSPYSDRERGRGLKYSSRVSFQKPTIARDVESDMSCDRGFGVDRYQASSHSHGSPKTRCGLGWGIVRCREAAQPRLVGGAQDLLHIPTYRD